jgi:translation initiation factor 1 (eIF-1/SUI1)
MNYIIGPSHIHSLFTHQIDEELINRTIFNNCILDGYCGIPIWSNHILLSIEKNTNNNIFWMVSDYKFNNHDYDKITEIGEHTLFLNEIGCPGNVNKDYMEYHHIELLGNHSLKVIDYIIEKYPKIKLIFWCLYKRTKANDNSSYPKHLWYDVIKEKYKNNIIDIDLFTTPNEFNSKILDDGAHPNREGYILLDSMIRSV